MAHAWPLLLQPRAHFAVGVDQVAGHAPAIEAMREPVDAIAFGNPGQVEGDRRTLAHQAARRAAAQPPLAPGRIADARGHSE
jgi:hypothetical protein